MSKREGRWKCICGIWNHEYNATCIVCGRRQPATSYQPPPDERPFGWVVKG